MTTPSPKRVAIYPGSFDPLTSGHVDIIERGARIFDSIIVAILVNVEKAPLFSETERVAIIRKGGQVVWTGDITPLATNGQLVVEGQAFTTLVALFMHLTGERYAALGWI